MVTPLLTRIKSRVKAIVRKNDFPLIGGDKKIYIFLSPDYGNYGDIAINYAQKLFLQSILPKYTIAEIPVSKFYNYYLSLKKIVAENDIVAVMGGVI